MERTLIATALASIIGIFAPQATAADTLARFQGGIGVIPVSSAPGPAATAETVNRNIVRGVQPPGQIWVIADLRADIKVDGRISVDGRGLLLGGGDSIGSNAGQSVFATLICETTPVTTPPTTPRTFSLHSTTPPVALEANGDFRIDDVLDTVPPNPCTNPVLLIRNAGGAWFAAGIPKL
jgi:hypothetical protein